MQLNFNNAKGIVRASSIQVPDYMRNRLSCGINWLDELFGSPSGPGFIAGSVFLFRAAPGGGKSTLCRQICAMTDLDCLYNSGEECQEQVKMALEERTFSEDFDVGNITDVDELLKEIETRKYQLVVVDSLQTLRTATDIHGVEIPQKKGDKMTVAVMEKIVSYAKSSLTTFILVCHSTKGGGFKGSTELEHDVDGTIGIDVELDKEEGVMVRTIQFTKNRWGMTFVEKRLNMTAHGITVDDSPVEQKERPARKAGEPTMKDVARKLFAAEMGLTREAFVTRLMELTPASKQTATFYYHTLTRNRDQKVLGA